MSSLRLALALVVCLLSLKAIAGDQPLEPPSTGPFSNPYGRSFQWLANPQVQEEIKLTEEQWGRIKQAQDEMDRKVRDLYKSPDLKSHDFRSRQQEVHQRAQALSEEAERKAEAILTARQAARLKQIIRQSQLHWRSAGILAVLLENEVAAELQLTDEQRQQLRQKQAELQRERVRKVQEFYRQLQQEARKQLFALLTADQRHKLEKLLGPEFELQPSAAGARLPGPPMPHAKPP